MKPYIIFDMDGVIIDSESWYMNQLKEFLHYQGYDIPKRHLVEMMGLDAKGIFKKLEKYVVNQDEIQYLFEKYLSQIQIPNYQQIVFPYVQECIENIFQKDIDIIIASSSPREIIEKVLIELNLYAYISYFVGREDVQYSKPNPEIYLSILRHQNGKKPLFVFEDSTYGIQAAKQAGLKVVAYYSGKFQNDQSESDLIITNHLQIIDIIMGGKIMIKEELASMFDHTFLKAYATKEDFIQLCNEAKSIGAAMVAINSEPVKLCKELLKGTNIHVGAAISFPLGQTKLNIKLAEAKQAINDGADEIDYVINIGKAKMHD